MFGMATCDDDSQERVPLTTSLACCHGDDEWGKLGWSGCGSGNAWEMQGRSYLKNKEG